MIGPQNKILEGSTVEDLARIVWQAGQYNTVVGKVAQLHATFLSFQDEDKLTEAVRDAATIDKYVPYREASAYCVFRTNPVAYFGPSRSSVSEQSGRPFRVKPVIHFGANRSAD